MVHKRLNNLFFYFIIFACLIWFLTFPALAADQEVTSNADSGAGTLRQAIVDAEDGDTITFNLASDSETITISSELSITESLTINGSNTAGTGTAVTVKVTNPEASDWRVFNISGSGKTVSISYMTISGGDIRSLAEPWGGGILLSAATLNLEIVTISGSSADYGGALYIKDNAVCTINRCSLSSCFATYNGGALSAPFGTQFDIRNTTISGNMALAMGGGIIIAGTVALNSVTIANNHSDFDSLGGEEGGGLYFQSGALTIKNCIIANNYRGFGTGTPDDYYYNGGTLTDNGYNFVKITNVGEGSDGFTDGINNAIVDTDPTGFASSLSYDGGFTYVLEVSSGNIASAAGSTSESTDQRGYYRNTSGSRTITRGAYQYDGVVAKLASAEWATGSATYTSIQAAYDTVSSGNTIDLAGTAIYEYNVNFSTNGKTITFRGAGVDSTIVQADDMPGTASGRVFYITDGTVTLEDMTVRYGKVTGASAEGGGIYSTASLTLTDMKVTECHVVADDAVDAYGGGIYSGNSLTLNNSTVSNNSVKGGDSLASANGGHSYGGGIYSNGSAAVTNSTISGNIATGGDLAFNFGTAGSSHGGGIYNESGQTLTITGGDFDNNAAHGGDEIIDFDAGGNAYGGGLHNNGTTVVSESTFNGNEVLGGDTIFQVGDDGGHAFGGGIFNDNGDSLKVTKTTINNNTAQGGDALNEGGIAQGGGVCQSGSGTMIFENVTISANRALDGTPGASGHGGGIDAGSGTATITNTTISANTASDNGGGILNDNVIYLANTISINNTASTGTGSDIYTNIGDTTYAYYSWYNGTGGSGTVSIQATAPCVTTAYTSGDLGPLANNGGSTLTMAVPSGKPAYQKGAYIYYNETDGYYIYDNQATPVAHKVNDWATAPSSPQASDKITTDQRGVDRGTLTTIGAYDDSPTLVEITSFSAQGFDDHVFINWETASEIDTAGFHLLRSATRSGTYARLTSSLIPAQGGPTTSATYDWNDTHVSPPEVWYYKLEEISTSGSRGFQGPVTGVVGDAAVKEVDGSGTIDVGDTAAGIMEIRIEGTGPHTITTGRYGSNPEGSPTFTPTGDYWFVDASDPGSLTGLTIRFGPAEAGDIAYYWNGTTWASCSQQQYANGCIEVSIDGFSDPRLSDLNMLVFAMGRGSVPIPTLSDWGAILFFLILAAGGILVVSRRQFSNIPKCEG